MIAKLFAATAVLACLAGSARAQYYYPTATYPVYATQAPVYAAPVYATPTYAAPVYAAPVYATPTYAAPVYATPYYGGYGGYYSPLSIGLNFGWGGGHRWR